MKIAAAARSLRLAGTAEPVAIEELGKAERNGKRLYEGPLNDPWGRAYVIRKRPTGTRWEVASRGQDGEPGTADDMVEQEPRGR